MNTNANGHLTVEGKVHFGRAARGRQVLQEGPAPEAPPAIGMDTSFEVGYFRLAWLSL